MAKGKAPVKMPMKMKPPANVGAMPGHRGGPPAKGKGKC
jgi:hypothetical protein